MLFTTYKNEDPMKELLVNRFLNNCLMREVAELYEVITGDDIFEVCTDKERAVSLLKSLLPLSYPKKMALKEYNRVLHLLMAGTTMTADLVNSYIIRIILNTADAKVDTTAAYFIQEMESFLDAIMVPLGIADEKLEEYRTNLPEILKDVEGVELAGMFVLGAEDNHTIDAMTKQELNKQQWIFQRTYTLLEDYLDAIRVKLGDKQEAE